MNRTTPLILNCHFAFWIIVSCCFLSLDYYHKLSFARNILNMMTGPIIYTVDQPLEATNKLKKAFQKKTQIIQTIQELQENQLILQVQLNHYRALENENKTLRQLLSSTETLKQHYVALAQLSNITHTSAGKSEYCINRGSKQGVKVGHIVLDAQGIVGQIIAVKANTSYLLNIDDPRNAVPVEVLRSGLRGILKGKGPGQLCSVDYLVKTSDIQVDDELISSGIGGLYPKGYPVACVTAVENSVSYPYLKVSAAPKAALTTNQFFLVLEI